MYQAYSEYDFICSFSASLQKWHQNISEVKICILNDVLKNVKQLPKRRFCDK